MGPPAGLIWTTQPSGFSGGYSFGNTPVVQLTDLGGNFLTNDGNTTIQIDLTDSGGTTSHYTTVVTASNGTASVPQWTLSTAGSYQLTATIGSTSAPTSSASNTFEVSVGSAATLQFTGPTAAVQNIAIAPVVKIYDHGGANVVTTSTFKIVLSKDAAASTGTSSLICSGSGEEEGRGSCASAEVAAVAGVATFVGISFSTAGSYVLLARTNDTSIALSTNTTITVVVPPTPAPTPPTPNPPASVPSGSLEIRQTLSLNDPSFTAAGWVGDMKVLYDTTYADEIDIVQADGITLRPDCSVDSIAASIQRRAGISVTFTAVVAQLYIQAAIAAANSLTPTSFANQAALTMNRLGINVTLIDASSIAVAAPVIKSNTTSTSQESSDNTWMWIVIGASAGLFLVVVIIGVYLYSQNKVLEPDESGEEKEMEDSHHLTVTELQQFGYSTNTIFSFQTSAIGIVLADPESSLALGDQKKALGQELVNPGNSEPADEKTAINDLKHSDPMVVDAPTAPRCGRSCA